MKAEKRRKKKKNVHIIHASQAGSLSNTKTHPPQPENFDLLINPTAVLMV
jgi:hypothetical protein